MTNSFSYLKKTMMGKNVLQEIAESSKNKVSHSNSVKLYPLKQNKESEKFTMIQL